jgi:hypothetical protein
VSSAIDHFLNTARRRETVNLLKSGAPGEIRTPDLQLRRLPLYPAELRARNLQFTSGLRRHQMPEAIQSVGSRIGVCCARLPATAPTTAAAAFTTAPTAATPAASSFRLRASFVHVQRASTYLGAIQRSDRFFSVFSACHLDKAEAA